MTDLLSSPLPRTIIQISSRLQYACLRRYGIDSFLRGFFIPSAFIFSLKISNQFMLRFLILNLFFFLSLLSLNNHFNARASHFFSLPLKVPRDIIMSSKMNRVFER